MEVIPWLWLLHSLHSWQTVVYIVYTTGGAFDLYSSHSTIILYYITVNVIAGIVDQILKGKGHAANLWYLTPFKLLKTV